MQRQKNKEPSCFRLTVPPDRQLETRWFVTTNGRSVGLKTRSRKKIKITRLTGGKSTTVREGRGGGETEDSNVAR